MGNGFLKRFICGGLGFRFLGWLFVFYLKGFLEVDNILGLNFCKFSVSF